MTDETSLLAAILANPEEDTPRLMYADWLQENDRPERAEFVRKGVRKPGPVWADNVPHLLHHRQTVGLLDRWSRPVVRAWLPAPLPGIRFNAEFRRGTLERIECSLPWWLAHGPAIVAAHPVTRVTLSDKEPASVSRGFVWRRDVVERGYLLEVVPSDFSLKWEYTSPSGAYSRSETYPTRELALDALSDACLAHARQPRRGAA